MCNVKRNIFYPIRSELLLPPVPCSYYSFPLLTIHFSICSMEIWFGFVCLKQLQNQIEHTMFFQMSYIKQCKIVTTKEE